MPGHTEKQQGATWGFSVVEKLAADVRGEFPGIQGSPARNIWYMRNFYAACQLCKSKDRIIVEYTLRESNRPIGVSAYWMVSALPAEYEGQMPTPEQVAGLLEGI